MMRIVFTQHARAQLTERGLAKASVEQALKRPDKIITQGPDRLIAVKRQRRAGKLMVLVVVYKQFDDQVTVITVFRTSKLKKYQ